jgi:hypothetical protein
VQKIIYWAVRVSEDLSTHLDRFEFNAAFLVVLEQAIEKVNSSSSLRTRLRMAPPCRDQVSTHGVIHHPIIVADGVIEAPFRAVRPGVGNKWCSPEEEAVQGDAKSPNIDRLSYWRTIGG